MADQNTWRCLSCSADIHEGRFLRAPNPFEPETELIGCPECKALDGFTIVCSEPGCKKEASCGWPSRQGYRHTCFDHSDFAKR